MAKKKPMPLEEALQVILAADGDNPLRQMLEWMVQQALEHEMTEHLGAESYERSDKRTGYRNGHRQRIFTTRVGDLELLIPLDRDGTFSTVLFERFQRSEKALYLSLMEMYVQGVSTRKVKEVTEKLCGRDFSSQMVSKLAKGLDEKVEDWRNRTLGAYPYLIVDAEYEKVRRGGRVISQGVLIVLGIDSCGMREILEVLVADTENIARMIHAFPIQLGDVDKPIQPAKVNESAKVNNISHFALDFGADLQIFDPCGASPIRPPFPLLLVARGLGCRVGSLF